MAGSIFDRITDNVASSWNRSLERMVGKTGSGQVQDPTNRIYGAGSRQLEWLGQGGGRWSGSGIQNPLGGGGLGQARGWGIPDPLRGFNPNPNAFQELYQLGLQRRGMLPGQQGHGGHGHAGPGTPGQGRGLDGTWQWKDMIDQAAQEAGIPPEVIQAIMGIESGGNADAYSVAGAVGLMQIMPNIWGDLAAQYGGNLNNPWTNIRTGAAILADLYNRTGSWEKAAAAYLGAYDWETGQITGAADGNGTTGYVYVDLFNQNLWALQNQNSGQVSFNVPPGNRVFPVVGYQGGLDLHHGSHPGAVDIFADYGTPVVAIMGGTAVSGYSDVGGYWTLITGDDGLQYYYAHMDRMGPNGRVEAGGYIAGVSDTGNAKGTGPHLHLGIGTTIYEGVGPQGGAGDLNVIDILNNSYRY